MLNVWAIPEFLAKVIIVVKFVMQSILLHLRVTIHICYAVELNSHTAPSKP